MVGVDKECEISVIQVWKQVPYSKQGRSQAAGPVGSWLHVVPAAVGSCAVIGCCRLAHTWSMSW